MAGLSNGTFAFSFTGLVIAFFTGSTMVASVRSEPPVLAKFFACFMSFFTCGMSFLSVCLTSFEAGRTFFLLSTWTYAMAKVGELTCMICAGNLASVSKPGLC